MITIKLTRREAQAVADHLAGLPVKEEVLRRANNNLTRKIDERGKGKDQNGSQSTSFGL